MIGGFDLLLHQAARQFELMTGVEPAPVPAMRAAGHVRTSPPHPPGRDPPLNRPAHPAPTPASPTTRTLAVRVMGLGAPESPIHGVLGAPRSERGTIGRDS